MNNPYLESLKPIWKKLKYVSTDKKRLNELIKKMAKEDLEIPAWVVPNVQPPINCKPAEWIDYISWVNTVNFAFTNFEPPYQKFTIEYPQGTFWDGAFALGASFVRAQKEGIPVFDANYMSQISLEEVKRIFRPIDYDHRIPLIEKRQEIFQEIGQVLLEKFNGSFLKIFIDGSWRAFNKGNGIVEQLVTNFPSFRDESLYKGHLLKFNKRAQLLVMMYHGRAVNSDYRMPWIKDIEDIGPIADYDVPRALKSLGVLKYKKGLEEKIKNRMILLPDCQEEIEIRVGMSFNMFEICKKLGISMAPADSYIWHMGRKSNEFHHLTPTTDY